VDDGRYGRKLEALRRLQDRQDGLARVIRGEFFLLPEADHQDPREERPRVGRRKRVSPSFPEKSPPRTAAEIAPPIAASTAAAAPPGRFAPSNRFTTTMSAFVVRISPETDPMRIVFSPVADLCPWITILRGSRGCQDGGLRMGRPGGI